MVGILIAAFYNPIWIHAVQSFSDFALAALLFVMLVFWRMPPWIIVLIGAAGGTAISYI